MLAIPFTQGGQHKGGKQQELQRIGLQKALFSSPAAALDSTQKRIDLLEAKPNTSADELSEIEALQVFKETLEIFANDKPAASFSKYQRLLQQLNEPEFGWQMVNAHDRLVIFSERIKTLDWLKTQLTKDLKLKPQQIEILDGLMSDTDQNELVDRFGRQEDPIRILLCSDVASEGLNLHYFCHRLIHFDLPWSLMVFQQRNGRVDRYGQKHQPQIVYLYTEAKNEKIKGDMRILEILQKKDDQANLNLGDPSAFLNVYDPEKEEQKVADFMAAGLSSSQVEVTLDKTLADKDKKDGGNEGDYMMLLFGGGQAAPASVPEVSTTHIVEPLSLFKDDFHFAVTALTQLNQQEILCPWSESKDEQIISLTAPLDLQDRLKQLPREAQAANDYYQLCAEPLRVITAIEEARQNKAEDDTWPTLQYLWAQHPIMEWLGDRVLTHFGRHRAPVLQSGKLAANEQAFILMSILPNRKGQPLMVEWQVATRLNNSGAFKLEAFESFVQRTGLYAGSLPNRGVTDAVQKTVEQMQSALPDAVKAMSDFMTSQQKIFAAQLDERLKNTLNELKRLQDNQITQLELRLEKQIESVKRSRFDNRSRQIGKVFDDYRQWVQDTLTTEPQPWIQVLGAVCNATAKTGA